jgi:peptidoglycan DL-endopeptidase CwlO
MRGFFFALVFLQTISTAQEEDAEPIPEISDISVDLDSRPKKITTSELSEFTRLTEARKKLIEAALSVLHQSPWLPYTESGADPLAGGFDCSGAIFYILSQVGIDPPRSSQAQFDWLKTNNRLHPYQPEIDPELNQLQPGDLVFWEVSAETPEEPNAVRIHHVAMYLGTEKSDGRRIMINSTDGRSYRGRRANGYGVYDFRVPEADSPSKIAGYGTPPGISE